LKDFKFLFLGTCQQNLIPTGHMEPWKKRHFVQRDLLKFTYKGRFWTLKKAYGKFLDWKSKHCAHALVPLLKMEVFLLKKTKISILGGILKFLKLIVFGQILAVLGRFCCIGYGWQYAQTNFTWNLINLIIFES
jgi:hypothetical protein